MTRVKTYKKVKMPQPPAIVGVVLDQDPKTKIAKIQIGPGSVVAMKQKDLVLPSPDELADSIKAIAVAMRAVLSSRLSKRAIVTLIAHNSKVAQSKVEIVLNNLERFDETWLKQKAAR